MLGQGTAPDNAGAVDAVLVITPGGGHDEGGIQRLVAAMVGLLPQGAAVQVIAPAEARRAWKVRLAWDSLRAAWSMRSASRPAVLCMHGAFLPISILCGMVLGCGVVGAYYGQEIWSAGPVRRLLWRRLPHVPLTISAYSAGALGSILRRSPTVLPPAFTARWAVGTDRSVAETPATPPLRVLSVFRLGAVRAKRPQVIVDAVEMLRAEGLDIELCLAGRGPVDEALGRVAAERPWVELVESPDDEQLSHLYRRSHVFVLATGVRFDRRAPSGEGFGIVLVEAALAGLAVIGPAGGGSRDAMVDGYTGLVVPDERTESLADAIRSLAVDPALRDRLAGRGRAWAGEMVSSEQIDRARVLLQSLSMEATQRAPWHRRRR